MHFEIRVGIFLIKLGVKKKRKRENGCEQADLEFGNRTEMHSCVCLRFPMNSAVTNTLSAALCPRARNVFVI